MQLLHLRMEEVDISVQRVKANALPAKWEAEEHGWLAKWHLLSLDAPTVVTVWTWFVARAAHTALPPAVPAAMFVAVWLLYAGDRLLDGLADANDLEERHRFHHRHRRRFAVAMVIAAVALIPLMLAIPWAILKLYVGLAVLLLSWITVVHRSSAETASRLPKELLPGAFCAAAAFIPIWANVGFRSITLMLAAICYALLCTMNCWAIYAWEHDISSQAHATTRFGVRWLHEIGIVAVAIPLATMAFSEAHLAPIFLAIAVAAGLLAVLDHVHDSLGRTDMRATADLVLLTPLLVAAVLR